MRGQKAFAAQAKATAAELEAMGVAGAKSMGRIAATGAKMQTVGSNLTRSVSVPIAAVGVVSGKMALDFEDSMNKIRNLVGSSQTQVSQWSDDILKLGPRLGASPQDLADALYFVASSGIAANKAMGVVKISAKAAALGLGDTKTVADAVTSAMNAYAKSGLSAKDATNTLAQAVKLGKGEPEDFAASIGRVIPIASKLGVPFHDVAAAMASMTLQGLDAAEATTALRGIFSATFKPTSDADKALKGVGLSAEELRNSLDKNGTLDTLQMLSDKFHGNVDAMAKVFPNIRGLVGAFNLTGDSAKKNAAIFDEMAGKTKMVQVGFQRLQQTDAQKLRRALAALQAAAIQFGEAILPIAAKAAEFFGGLANALGKLPAPMQKLIVDAAALALVAGPLLWIFGSLGKAFLPLMTGLVRLIGFIREVALAMEIFDVGMIAATSTVVGFDIALLAIPLAVVAVAAALVILYLKVKWFRDKVNAVFEFIKDHWRLLLIVLTAGAAAPFIAIADRFGSIKNAAVDAFGWIKTAAQNTFGWLKTATGNIGGWFSGAAHAIKSAFKAVIQWFRTAWENVLGWIEDKLNHLIDAANVIPGVDIAGFDTTQPLTGQQKQRGHALRHGATPGTPFDLFKPPKKAMGGPILPGGTALVGERGPELATFPFGARIHDTDTTKQLLSSRRGEPTIVIPIHLDGRVIAETVVKAGQTAKARR